MTYGKCEENEIDEYTREDLRQLELAIEVGTQVLDCLKKAKQQLEEIQAQGFFERISRGVFGKKYDSKRINGANQTIKQAKELLIVFQRKLRYIKVPNQLKIEIEGFVTFADFFFDSLLADWYVQSKLKKSLDEVEDAMRQILEILEKLNTMKAEKYN